jgi:hypothetical protein
MKKRGDDKNCTNPLVVNGKIAILLRHRRARMTMTDSDNQFGYFS